MDSKRLKYLKVKVRELLKTNDGEELLELLSYMAGFEKRSLTFDGSKLNRERVIISAAERDFYLNIINLKDFKGDTNE